MPRLVLPRLVLAAVLLTGTAATSATAVAAGAIGATRPAAVDRSPAGPDVWTYHGNNGRSGQATADRPGRLSRAWARRLDGAVYAQPLLVTLGGRRTLIVATEANVVYGLNPATGRVRWHTRPIGRPARIAQLPCGDIDPLGITGTPVYEPRSRAVWAVAETSSAGGQVHHVLVALDPTTGRIRTRRNVDPPGQDPRVEQQRGALLAENGTIYVPYGGLAGDCGNYHGYIVGSSQHTGKLTVFRTPSSREAGIWTPPGAVADAAGHLYVAVGNGAATGGRWDHSDSVLELSPGLHLIGAFAPTQWAADNAADRDLGSSAPTLLPNGVIYTDGKSSTAYTLRAGHLHGVGTELSRATVCAAYGGTARRANTVFVPCDDGLRAVAVAATGRMRVTWHAQPTIDGSPVVAGTFVFVLDQTHGALDVLAAGTGKLVGSVAVGAITRFATPTVSGGRAFVGTTTGVVAVAGV